jgi:hypothetical protein
MSSTQGRNGKERNENEKEKTEKGEKEVVQQTGRLTLNSTSI